MTAHSASLLIVDDEKDACQNLADIFQELGFHVDIAFDGSAALEMARHRRHDVALLDLMMPGMDGASLYDELKRRNPSVVAVLTTAYPAHPRAEASAQAGIWRIVPKPLDPAHLSDILEEALKQPLILLVDDDAELCSNLWDILRQQNFRVSIAHETRTAVELLKGDGFKLVLVDLKLPDGDGTEILRAVQQIGSAARTILISGYREKLEAILGDSHVSGPDAICHKPFDMDRLLELVVDLRSSYESCR